MTTTTTTRAPETLDELWAVLADAPENTRDDPDAEERYARRYGLPTAHGEIAWDSLPTYGGEEPADTVGIWSWDETRLLVGDRPSDLKLVERAEWVDDPAPRRWIAYAPYDPDEYGEYPLPCTLGVGETYREAKAAAQRTLREIGAAVRDEDLVLEYLELYDSRADVPPELEDRIVYTGSEYLDGEHEVGVRVPQ